MPSTLSHVTEAPEERPLPYVQISKAEERQMGCGQLVLGWLEP